jgi:hypothetical protein
MTHLEQSTASLTSLLSRLRRNTAGAGAIFEASTVVSVPVAISGIAVISSAADAAESPAAATDARSTIGSAVVATRVADVVKAAAAAAAAAFCRLRRSLMERAILCFNSLRISAFCAYAIDTDIELTNQDES